VILIVAFFSGSVNSLTLRFGDDPDTGDQDSHFGVMITNQSGDDYFLYGHNATTEDMYLYANNVDANPYMILEGNDDITLQSGDDVFIGGYLGPFINMTNGDDITLDAVDDIVFADNAAQMFKFEISGDDSIIYGSDGATEDTLIYATSGDASTYIKLDGSDTLGLYADTTLNLIPDNGVYMYHGLFQFMLAGTINVTGVNNLTLDPGSNYVNINSILRLNPIASPPSTPAEGMIYYDSGNNTLCCWTGTGWRGFW